jgi:hypothetical protein
MMMKMTTTMKTIMIFSNHSPAASSARAASGPKMPHCLNRGTRIDPSVLKGQSGQNGQSGLSVLNVRTVLMII